MLGRLSLLSQLLLSAIMVPAAFAGGMDSLAADNGAAPLVYQPAGWSTPRLISGIDLALPGGDPAAIAGEFAARYREIFLPADPESEVRLARLVASPFGPVAQMEQWFRGHRVLSSSLIVSMDPVLHVRLAVNDLRALNGVGAFEALLPGSRAVALAKAAFPGRTRGEPRLETVWMEGAGELFLAHLVTVPGSSPLGDFTYLIAGPEGRILWVFQRLPMAQGYAYKQNPLKGNYETVTLENLTSAQHLSGTWVEVYNCTGSTAGGCNSAQQLATPDANGDYLIEPTGANDPQLPNDKFGEVQAYYGVNTIRDYFIGIGANPTALKIGVNCPMDDSTGGPNAFYSDQQPDFGNGPGIMIGQYSGSYGTIDLSADNDVIFHEYGHHVFGEASSASQMEMDQYGPVTWGLAMNEGSADYFSCSALDDPSLGEYFASLLPVMTKDHQQGFLRKLDNQLTCPDGLYGEAHDDSMVWTGFVWEVRALVGKDKADPLYLDVISHFPQKVDFPTVTQVYLQRAALVLDAATVDQITAIAKRRGIDVCQRFIAITRTPHIGFVYSKQILGQYGNMLPYIPGELHYTIDVPSDAVNLEIDWSSNPKVSLSMMVRADQAVTNSFSYGGGLKSTYDFMLDQGGVFDLKNPDTTKPFAGGHKYFLEPANKDNTQPYTEYTIFGGFTCETGFKPAQGDDGKWVCAPQCPTGQEPKNLEGQWQCVPICQAGTTLQKVDGQWTCLPVCQDPLVPVQENGQWVCDCPTGFAQAQDNGQTVCVPVCKKGYAPQKQDGGWVCTSNGGSGCGCGSVPGTAAFAPILLVLLALIRRRFTA